jgi:PAS domain S-box-containing protein
MSLRAKAFDASPVAILVADDERRYVDANPAACALFGVPLSGLLGKRIDDFAPPPPHYDVDGAWRAFLVRGTDSGEFPLVSADGTPRVLAYRAVANVSPGEHASYLVDVTEQRAMQRELAQSKNWLEAMLAQVPLPVYVVDRDAVVVRANAYAHATLDAFVPLTHIRRDRALHLLDGTIVPFEDLPSMRALRGETVSDMRVRFPSDHGDVVFSLSSAPLRDADGVVTHAIVVVRDVTAECRAEEVKETFLGVLGHDLRNPLSSIVTGSHLLLHGSSLGEKDRSIARRMLSSALRMGRLIEQVLDLTRARVAGGIVIHRQPTNLHPLILQIIEEAKTSTASATFDVSLEGRDDGEWDADRLSQVFENLISNAVRHGEGSPIRIHADERDDGICVSVSNAGAPIPADLLPIIFEPFRKADRKRTGLGLGLYIAREIVTAHAGTIKVNSILESGTTFHVWLPFNPP